MKVLNNLKVKTKILLIVLLGVFSVFLVSIPTIFELNSSVDRITKAEDLSRLDRRFHNMRIQEKNFMLRHDEVSLNNHEIYYDESMKVIDELSKKFKNPQNLEALANIKESMQKYREKFLIYIKKYEGSIVLENKLLNEESDMVTNAREIDSLVTNFRRGQNSQANTEIEYLKIFVIVVSFLAFIFLIAMGTLIGNSIIYALEQLKSGLLNFFAFLNRKKDFAEPIILNSKDEFGLMAKSINKNIKSIEKLHLELFELNTQLEKKVNQRTKELKEANEQITKSIDFAAIIQQTFNCKEERVKDFFDDYFILLNQREKVGGDIILFEKINEDECLLMDIDCTSHGVPGAFVTMIVIALQRQILKEIELDNTEALDTSLILKRFNYEIKHLLEQTSKNSKSNVGFDGQIVYYNRAKNILKFSGARNDIVLFIDGQIKRIKGDRHSVGYKNSDENYEFTQHTINIEKDTILYIYSDGFTDQIGGNKLIPFGKMRTLNILKKCWGKKLQEQKEHLLRALKNYRKSYEQNDDISFVGLRIKKN
ncbi:SpoIIE family protein phosphatase [Halarcobacter anaerophilus]|uniref:PPM-type phosphatase domain-containing protein n=1 Tax=Halarcobacter anaerophilus TaxID=877500 RepID=A0A4Q0XUX0_9BACT|nr:SpoIIE family protein phosphatase [Halarcobacter anaerophilus]QDF28812.1 putative membrane protein [Halarcobacter anaerophilus]RXJ61276.1 hypothetical protein CRV06_14370 [Halarcobacter anaerophilus]